MKIDTDAMGNAIAEELERQGATEGVFVLLLQTQHPSGPEIADCNIVSNLEAHQIPLAVEAFRPMAKRMQTMGKPEGSA